MCLLYFIDYPTLMNEKNIMSKERCLEVMDKLQKLSKDIKIQGVNNGKK